VQAFVDTYGKFNFLKFPASLDGTLQSVSAINDLGQIVGQYGMPSGPQESFIATSSKSDGLVNLWHGLPARAFTWALDINSGHVNLPIATDRY
jgi:hypothetical protein